MKMKDHELEVGSVVRVCRLEKSEGGRRRLTGQATVATVEYAAEAGDETTCCVLMHDSAPRILLESQQSSFIICPKFELRQDEQEERALSSQELLPLLEFEDPVNVLSSSHSYCTFKERGDSLFQLGDATMAASWYEAALATSSDLTVGCVIAAKLAQHKSIQIYEVDCVEEDSVDAVSYQTNEEVTIPKSQVLLSLLTDDKDNHIQERILLNLSRCMMQLAGLPDKSAQNRPYEYRRAAAWACTLVLEMFTYKKQEHEASSSQPLSLQETALLLRAKAYFELQKWKLARDSIRRLLVLHPNHREGLALERKVNKEQAVQFKANKKLAKEVCQWVDKASDTNKHSDEMRGESSPQLQRNRPVPKSKRNSKHNDLSKTTTAATTTSDTHNGPFVVFLGILCFLALMSFWIQRHLSLDSAQEL